MAIGENTQIILKWVQMSRRPVTVTTFDDVQNPEKSFNRFNICDWITSDFHLQYWVFNNDNNSHDSTLLKSFALFLLRDP